MEENLLVRYIMHHVTPEEEMTVKSWLRESDANRRRLFELEQLCSLRKEMEIRKDTERMDRAFSALSDRLGFAEEEQKPVKTAKTFRLAWYKVASVAAVLLLLVVNVFFLTREEKQAWNTVFVPKGQRVSLLLSDGTTVWLNSESRFSYPTQFTADHREAKLEGEGYFEVAHNPKCPFTLSLPMLDVHVLGTKFNARAYSGEPCSVALKEGSVEVETADHAKRQRMEPGDEVNYTPRNGLVLIKGKKDTSIDTWTTGDLMLKDMTLRQMIRQMERHFDVKIYVGDNALLEEYFTCHIRKDLTINQVMDLLKETRRLDYTINHDSVYIFRP